MARELELTITANTQQAEQAAGRVETALGKVEEAAKGADAAIEKHDKALKKTSETTRDVVNDTNLLTQTLLKYAGPAVILEATRRTLAFSEQIVQMSKRTGIAIEAVQKLGNTAERAGLSFNTVASAIAKLDAGLAGGNLKVTSAVKGLGLSVDTLLKLKPEDRFAEIARAIGGIEDPARRAEAAVAIFGRSGTQLIPMFQDIRDGALEASAALSEDFVRAGDEVQGSLELIYERMKTLGQAFLLWPAAWAVKMRELGETIRGVAGELPAVPSPGLPTNGALPVPGLPADLTSIERELTRAVRDNTVATERNSVAMGAALGPLASSQLPGMGGTAPFNGSGWGMFRPGVGMMPPSAWSAVLPSSPLFDPMNPATWNGTGFGTLRTAVQPNMPGAGGGGGIGGFFKNLFSGKLGQGGIFGKVNGFLGGGSFLGGLAGQGLGMLTGLIPGMSGKGSSIGSMVGSFLGPLGSIGGGLLGGLVGKLFGKNEHSKVNDVRDEFTAAMGGIDALAQKAADAGLTLEKFYKAKTIKQFEEAVRELNDAFGDQEQDAARLQVAMQKYGLSIGDMGAKFKQTEMNKGFKELGEDFRVLIEAGADFNVVAEKMAPSFSELINTAIETGTEVPRELEPIIRKMLEMGLITDRNGDKIEDLGKIPFAQSMTEGFDKVVKAIDKLRAAIQGVADDFDDAADAAGNFGDAASNVPGGPGDTGGGGGDQTNVYRGGVIRGRGDVLYLRQGGFVPSGTDTVPAMLTPGEMVLSRDVVRDIAAAGRRMDDDWRNPANWPAPVFDKLGAPTTREPLTDGPSPFLPLPDPRDTDLHIPTTPGERGPGIGSGDGIARTQPVPFERSREGDVVLVSVPAEVDAAGLIQAVERQLGRSIPGNRNRLRDVLDTLYERKGGARRRVA